MHTYDENYYRYITDGSLRSAEIVLPLVSRLVPVRSVVDFGAGAGAWLCAWQRLGVADVPDQRGDDREDLEGDARRGGRGLDDSLGPDGGAG